MCDNQRIPLYTSQLVSQAQCTWDTQAFNFFPGGFIVKIWEGDLTLQGLRAQDKEERKLGWFSDTDVESQKIFVWQVYVYSIIFGCPCSVVQALVIGALYSGLCALQWSHGFLQYAPLKNISLNNITSWGTNFLSKRWQGVVWEEHRKRIISMWKGISHTVRNSHFSFLFTFFLILPTAIHWVPNKGLSTLACRIHPSQRILFELERFDSK